ncbi:glycoside hydrolase/deacetylase [Nadsonia fulvescens var. elongata DSM 6958]|uniref:chitin deacetylase n=1 Tax=Nadsonia fulvescens var. elongata DSM 6958 TaxID=857566 RepID=A0A1E3PHR6_9ASCO|nr:glycoside hydrolase/deacetylase [Nadsonia fulvescens var. elongata DSM 6958]
MALGPFPKWLSDFTGLSEWPGMDPPYISMEHVDLSEIPEIPTRAYGDCSNVLAHYCSFECGVCVAPDDIHTCPTLSQTFDDGPTPFTSFLFDKLPTKNTFFTQGINVVRRPDTFRMAHKKGHHLATHTWSHKNLPTLSNEEIVAQFQWSIWAMNATAGIIPKYYRPPYGSVDDRVRAITRQLGLICVLWDRDSLDWMANSNLKSASEIFDAVRLWRNSGKGGLLLEHDNSNITVSIGIGIGNILGNNQMTVAECAGNQWYQN